MLSHPLSFFKYMTRRACSSLNDNKPKKLAKAYKAIINKG